MSPEFAQTFVLSVKKLLNARCKERCGLLSMPLTHNWLHLSIWCKFLPLAFSYAKCVLFAS